MSSIGASPNPVKIQTSSQSVPSTPAWLGEVALVAHALKHWGIVEKIEQEVRFARARFGRYEVIDFVGVLIGYAVSGEATLEAFYERLSPFASVFMALFGRHELPVRSTLSRFLAALDSPSVEALRGLFQADLVARGEKGKVPGGMWDHQGRQWLVWDADGTREAARQRALPQTDELPAPHRRFDLVCAKGYGGRKRGEVVRTRTTLLQAHSHQWGGTYSGAGNGDYRGELLRATEAIIGYAKGYGVPLSQVIVRLDGLYGNAAPLMDVLNSGLGVIVRGKEYGLLDLPEVQAVLAQPADQETTHPESGTMRQLFDCPHVALGAAGPSVRMIVATHPASSQPAKIGVTREGTVCEQFFTTLPQEAFTSKDVLDLYLHRGSFEGVLADEDVEQDPDRWCSRTPCGQEFWQILAQWVWNLRLELGQLLHPTAMRLTEFSPAQPAQPVQPVQPVPARFAHAARKGRFAGSDFALQPDGSLRMMYAARLADCRSCELRQQCQSPSAVHPRHVSAVLASVPPPPPPPACALPSQPLLWGDFPRSVTRRRWMSLLRCQTVLVTVGPATEQALSEPLILTRAQRAHWRLSWEQRLARNARSGSAPALTVTVHGLPNAFATALGLSCLQAA